MTLPKNYAPRALTGGGSTSLDAIDGAALIDTDMSLSLVSGVVYPHWLDDDVAGSESSPTKITPDSNAGNKRWVLAGIYCNTLVTVGNVGIGTTSPTGKTHSVSNTLYNNISAAFLATSDATATYDAAIGIGADATTHAAYIQSASYNSYANRPLLLQPNGGNVGIGTASPGSALEVAGYTTLGTGAPKVKMKKLTGTTGSSEGDLTTIAHGLTGAKIISVTAKIEYATNCGVSHGYTKDAEYEFDLAHDASNVKIQLSASNSGGLLSKGIIVTIFYEE